MKNLDKHPLYAYILENKIPKLLEKPPNIKEYKDKGDPYEHVQLMMNVWTISMLMIHQSVIHLH